MRITTCRLRLACSVLALSALFLPRGARGGEMSYVLETPAASIQLERDAVADRAVASDPQFYYVAEAGLPALPYRVISLLLPPGEAVDRFEIVSGPPTVIASSVRLAVAPPAEGPDGLPASTSTAAVWNETAYPSEGAVYLGTGYLHGCAIASFAVYPVSIAAGTLTVNERVELRVTTRGDDPTRRVARRLRYREGFEETLHRRLEGLVVNTDEMSAYAATATRVPEASGGFNPTSLPALEGSGVDYVIITNDSLAAAFQILADWKTAKGVRTVVRTTEWIQANYRNGVDPAETIRTFILDAYQKWGITYALLGGDAEQVPVRLGASKYLGTKDLPADMYFGCLDGDWNADHDKLFGEGGPTDQADLYQEVYTGRLPAVSVATASIMINKIMSYETPADPSYTGTALLLAEVLFPTDWDGSAPITQDGAAIAEFAYALALDDPALTVSRMYENNMPYNVAPETRASTLAALNAGVDQVNHIGHGFRFNMSVGDGSVVNADADVLTNTDRYSNMYLLNCTVVAYTYFCLGEHFLLSPAGGAVSVIGANESAYPLISQPYMNEYYDLLINDDVVHIGEAFARSREPRTPIASNGDNADLWTHYIYTILADPEMPLWTAPVQPLVVSHPTLMQRGTTNVTVHVNDAGGPVAGATVCLSKGSESYGVGTTDANGNVALKTTAESAGSVRVVATALNRSRYEGSIYVLPSIPAYVSYVGLDADDDAVGATSGNGDGVIDAGEVIEFITEVGNTGNADASGVTLTLRSSTSGVLVEDSTALAGTVAAGDTSSALDSFRVRFAPGIADETPAAFTLVVNADDVPGWTGSFKKLVHAPAIEFDVLRIDDATTGNGDGLVQAGENVRVYYTIRNFGTGAAYGLAATLTDLEGAFTITNGASGYASMTTAGAAENATGFALSESSVATEHDLRLAVTDAHGNAWEKVFELRPPPAPVNLTFNPSVGPTRLQLAWDAPPGSTDVNRYRAYRSLTAGGPYTVATVDPVRHTTFLDTGLQPTTRYYYRVSAVDVSGNESALSAEYSGSTNPAQVVGWPIKMSVETVSSPVMGDIDGDHDFELIQGDGKLYAWHHNGVELRDADANAQTWGLFSTLGNSFVSHPALAEIDAVNGLDILAASRDTREVFAFNYTGNVIAGWPRPVENAIRAGLVAGDINGDGQKEVIAIDEKGVLYVWRANGAEYRNGDNNAATQGIFRKFGGCVYQYTCPAIGNFDADGLNEIVVGTQGDSVFVLNENGTLVPGWPKAFSSDISGSIALGDIDGNGDLEMVVCEYGGNVWALNHDGTTMWMQWFPNQLTFGPSPALGDLDGDGKLEVVVPSKNRNLYAIRYNGGYLPGWPVVYTSQLWTESSPVIADINNDGSLDVVLGDETRFINGWDAAGQPLAGFPLATGDAVRATPMIADLDKDGDVEVIAAGWDKTVYVWDFPAMFNPLMAPWSKFHANLYNDGNIHTPVPTPVRAVSFNFTRRDAGMELVWAVPAEAGGEFTVRRAEVVGGETGGFALVAAGVGTGVDGMVRVVDRGVEMGSRYVYHLENTGGTLIHETAGLYVPVTRAVLGQNYPNPFNPVTKIEYWVPEGSGKTPVSLVIYDVRGARVRTVVNEGQAAGRYVVEWDGRTEGGAPAGSGVYFYKLQTPGFSDARKMVLLK